MKITERMIEMFNANRPVHMQLLKKLLLHVPRFNVSTQKNHYYEEFNLNARNSDFGGQVYDFSLISKDKDGKSTTNNLPVDIDDQLHKYDQQKIQPLREQISQLEQRIANLENK